MRNMMKHRLTGSDRQHTPIMYACTGKRYGLIKRQSHAGSPGDKDMAFVGTTVVVTRAMFASFTLDVQ